MRNRVVFAILGQTRDRKGSQEYRPTVALVLQPKFPVERLELFYGKNEEKILKTITEDIRALSPNSKIVPHLMQVADRWNYDEVFQELHTFFDDYKYDIDGEEYFVTMATGTHVEMICFFLLTKNRYIPGKLLQLIPPENTNSNIIGTHKIIDLDLSQYDRLTSLTVKEQQEGITFLKHGIATKNAAFNALIDEIEQVVASRTTSVLRQHAVRKKDSVSAVPKPQSVPPVLLTGATGVGKSLLARRIFELKKQRQLLEGNLIEVNCATLRGTNAMSALFGHVKGAFTGAVDARTGYLRAADGGMLFLDEIGELGLEEQAMLLKAIEEKRFQPVGSDGDVVSNFQLIAGTNRDLDTEVTAGRFREDLLSRINLWVFRLPTLAERREDIEPNIDYELAEYERQQGLKIEFDAESRRQFLLFAQAPASSWKANFRDLNAAIVRMAMLSQNGRIKIETVNKEIERLEKQWNKQSQNANTMHGSILEHYFDQKQIETIDYFDQVQLAATIQVCQHCQTLSEAGRVLFQHSRTQKQSANDASRLHKYLDRFGIDWECIQKKQDKKNRGALAPCS